MFTRPVSLTKKGYELINAIVPKSATYGSDLKLDKAVHLVMNALNEILGNPDTSGLDLVQTRVNEILRKQSLLDRFRRRARLKLLKNKLHL